MKISEQRTANSERDRGPATTFAQVLRGREEISITVIGRRTKRRITLPVWFVTEGTTLWLLPVGGSRSQWYRNLLADPTITVQAGRRRHATVVRLVRSRSTVQSVVAKFRRKYTPEQILEYYSRFDAAVAVPLPQSTQSPRSTQSTRSFVTRS